jgi:glycine cleavage system H protein
MNHIPEHLKYTKTHEWFENNAKESRIGITFHAQNLLGDLVFIELPKVGQKFSRGETLGVLESVKAASDYYAPVNGVVTAVNQAVCEHPELLNHDPYEQGWLVKFAIINPDDTKNLLSAAEYKATIAGEA